MTQALRSKYATAEDFLNAINPDRQLKVCSNPSACFFGSSPTLFDVNLCYGKGAAEAWLVPEVQEACLFFGLKEMPDIPQLRKLTMIIAANFGYLKVDELQLFFFNFCSGKYRHFFNTFDPYIILQSIRDFLVERARAIELREQKIREREWEESKRSAITYEEYLERKKAAEASAQDAADMKV